MAPKFVVTGTNGAVIGCGRKVRRTHPDTAYADRYTETLIVDDHGVELAAYEPTSRTWEAVNLDPSPNAPFTVEVTVTPMADVKVFKLDANTDLDSLLGA